MILLARSGYRMAAEGRRRAAVSIEPPWRCWGVVCPPRLCHARFRDLHFEEKAAHHPPASPCTLRRLWPAWELGNDARWPVSLKNLAAPCGCM